MDSYGHHSSSESIVESLVRCIRLITSSCLQNCQERDDRDLSYLVQLDSNNTSTFVGNVTSFVAIIKIDPFDLS